MGYYKTSKNSIKSSFSLKVSRLEKKSHLLKNGYAVSNLNLPVQCLSEDEIKESFKNTPIHSMNPYTNVVPKSLIGLDHHAHLGKSVMSVHAAYCLHKISRSAGFSIIFSA